MKHPRHTPDSLGIRPFYKVVKHDKDVKLAIFRRPRKKAAGKAREYRGMKRT